MANLHHWRVMQHHAMIMPRFAIVIQVHAIALMLLAAQGVRAQPPLQDSLELKLLECDIEQARQKATQSDFWHRLIPRISLTASLGLRDVLFLDGGSGLPYVLPRDAYRLTVTLSLSDILDGSQHAVDLIQIRRLRVQYARLIDRQLRDSQILRKKLLTLDEESLHLRTRVGLTEDVLRFRQLLFDQGKIHYDELIRSKLDLLEARESLNRLGVQQLELQLRNGRTQ
jgi:outer membrane protein TolC